MSEIAVVILNYNGKDLLRQFLPSVIQFSPGARIIVADNGSTDGSLELLRQNFSEVEIIAIGSNLGFCGGYNFALKKIESVYYVLLNSDVEVTPGWLHPLAQALTNNKAIAAAQPKILSFHNKRQFEYAGAAGGFIDSLGYPFCRGRIFQTLEDDRGQYNDSRTIFWATGACLFVRAEAFHRVGGLDEDFFAHMEEIDLCWKLQRLGYTIQYVGNSHVYHVGGGTLSASNPRKTYLNFRNGLTLLCHHLPPGELAWKLPFRILLDWVAAIRFLTSPANTWAVLKAHLHFVARLGGIFGKRTTLRARLGGYSKKNILRGLLVSRYYLLRQKTFKDLGEV